MVDEPEKSDMIAILKVLEQDWALVDDHPEEGYLVCVNESRDVMEDFFPKKALVKLMESRGLIEDRGKDMPPQPSTHSYLVTHADGRTEEVIRHNPHVYLYKVTDKGRDVLQSDT